MDKNILVQYREMMEEIKDIRRRRKQLEQRIQQLTVVSDTVKGTRKDGTIGCIKITGYPVPEYYRNRGLLQRYDAQDRKSTRLNSSHCLLSRMPSSA